MTCPARGTGGEARWLGADPGTPTGGCVGARCGSGAGGWDAAGAATRVEGSAPVTADGFGPTGAAVLARVVEGIESFMGVTLASEYQNQM